MMMHVSHRKDSNYAYLVVLFRILVVVISVITSSTTPSSSSYFFVVAGASTTSSSASTTTNSCRSSLSSIQQQWNTVKQSTPFVLPNTWLPEFIYNDYLSETATGNSMEWKDVVVASGIMDTTSTSNDDTESCANDNENTDDNNYYKNFPAIQKVTIGKMPQFRTEQSLDVLQKEAMKYGWDGGYGIWPQMSLQDRIQCIQKVVSKLQEKRDDIIHALMFEIGKNYMDATSELDRTIQFIQHVIHTIQTDRQFIGSWNDAGQSSNHIYTRRNAIGIIMCLAPYNYPLNESYAAIIPALLMGNVVILKIPTIGGLVHLLTMEAFRQYLPRGVMNFVSGGGRTTMPPIMATGNIDALAFIGGKNAANQLIHIHPNPHRLKVFLQLEAKNMGIFLKNLFTTNDDEMALDHALQETITGTLSYNGQRCTALKLLFVPKQYAPVMITKLIQKVQQLPIGLPWQIHPDGQYSKITPLPTMDRIVYMKELIQDALDHGAKIMNPMGGMVIGGENSTLMIPAIMYPITPSMRLYTEEQFGPIIPIVPYDTMDTIYDYAQNGIYGQQVSIFTKTTTNNNDDEMLLTRLIDRFSTIFGKININNQCGRSPDHVPFSGRRSSAMGVMSVKDALLEFSIPTVVTYNTKGTSTQPDDLLFTHLKEKSTFLQPPLHEGTTTTK